MENKEENQFHWNEWSEQDQEPRNKKSKDGRKQTTDSDEWNDKVVLRI